MSVREKSGAGEPAALAGKASPSARTAPQRTTAIPPRGNPSPLAFPATDPVVTHVPGSRWVPARTENVTIEADVSDPDGLTLVSAAYCSLPPFTCILYDLQDPDGDGHWTTGARVRLGRPPDDRADGAYFNVTVT